MSIELQALKEQTAPLQCPYCYIDLTEKDIIGETEYDVVRIGHNMGGIAVVFGCPCCFKKSFIHKENLRWKTR
jgi:hypothetical protein